MDFFSPAKSTREGNEGGMSLADMHSPSLADPEESAKSEILERRSSNFSIINNSLSTLL